MTAPQEQAESTPADDFKIRHLRSDDIPLLQAIDRRITERAATWHTVDEHLAGEPLLSFVAEHRGMVVGFLLGDVKSYEFGLAQSAWIEAMGVAPEHQRKGIAKRLVKAFLDHCRRSGLTCVNALIKQNDAPLQAFFKSIGFTTGDLVNIQRHL